MFKAVYSFFNKKWYVDRIYNEVIGQQLLHLCLHTCYKSLDRGLLEQFGPFGIVKKLKQASFKLVTYQSGYVLDYVSYICVSVLIFLIPLNLFIY
jgi:NADH:ubiquinone oxidoreductase subunit 5 (subunit L)/multisubunit Na+/H+ antiporter MnhA subunit